MPLLRGSVSFSRFQVTSDRPAALEAARKSLWKILRTRAFEPLGKNSEEDRSVGFVELENPESTEFSPGSLFYGEHALFSFRIDTVRLPASALRAEMARTDSHFEKQHGRKPSRKEKNELKLAIRQQLKNRTFPNTRVQDVSWNLKSGQLQIWAGSRKGVEEVQAALETALSIKLVPQVPGALLKADEENPLLGPTAELLGVEPRELQP